MILLKNVDYFTSADTQQQTGFCTTLFHCVSGGGYFIFGSGTKLFVGKSKLSFSFSCFIEQVENVFVVLVSAASGFTC